MMKRNLAWVRSVWALVLVASIAAGTVGAVSMLELGPYPLVASAATTNVIWRDVEKATIGSDNSFINSPTQWVYGSARSQQEITGTGSVQFPVPSGMMYAGLHSGAKATQSTQLQYAINPEPSILFASVRENGVWKKDVAYVPGDTFAVSVNAGQVTYLKNGVVFYTSTVPASYPLYFNVVGLSQNARLPGPSITTGSGVGTSSVALTAPSSGSTLSGVVSVSASASNSGGIAGVQFKVDSVNAGAEDTTFPYEGSIDTTQYIYGTHVLTAVARDSNGNLTTSAPVAVTFNNASAPMTKLMPLGDSLTYGAGDDAGGGYRRSLWQALQGAGITNVDFVGSVSSGLSTIDRDHEGHGGWAILDILSGIDTWLPAYQPNVIMLMIGYNDLNQGATPAMTLARLSDLLDKIHALRPQARILVANQPGATANNSYPEVTAQEIIDYNAGIPAQVQSRAALGWNISFVDIYGQSGLDRSAGSPDFSGDGLHESPQGYDKIGAVWFAAFQR